MAKVVDIENEVPKEVAPPDRYVETIKALSVDLAETGMPIRLERSDVHPRLPEDAYPVFHLELSREQGEVLMEVDGSDPTHIFGDDPIPAGGEVRRMLSKLMISGVIGAWHTFKEGEEYGLHIQCSQEQAEMLYKWLDWDNGLISLKPGKRYLHRFG